MLVSLPSPWVLEEKELATNNKKETDPVGKTRKRLITRYPGRFVDLDSLKSLRKAHISIARLMERSLLEPFKVERRNERNALITVVQLPEFHFPPRRVVMLSRATS